MVLESSRFVREADAGLRLQSTASLILPSRKPLGAFFICGKRPISKAMAKKLPRPSIFRIEFFCRRFHPDSWPTPRSGADGDPGGSDASGGGPDRRSLSPPVLTGG